MPEAHPFATATAVLAPAASDEQEGEGAQPIHVDEPARKKAEALAAARVKQERAKAVLAGREVSVSQSVKWGLVVCVVCGWKGGIGGLVDLVGWLVGWLFHSTNCSSIDRWIVSHPIARPPQQHHQQQAVYQAARDEAALRQADYRGAQQTRAGIRALEVDPREHERLTPPLGVLLPAKGTDGGEGEGEGQGTGGYKIGEYRVESEGEGYEPKEYKSVYDK
jgi:hypothetical protein